MTLAIPSCWDGFRIRDCLWHAAHRPAHYKVELVSGVLSVSLRTRATREFIAALGEALAGPAAERGYVVGTSVSGGGEVTPPEQDRRLRRGGLFHEVVVGQLHATLRQAVRDHGADERWCAVLGAGWDTGSGDVRWPDVCLVARDALVCPVGDRSWASDPPPPLVIEVLETEDDDEVERTAAAYRQGGCEQLVVIEPADPEIGRTANRFRAYDLTATVPHLEVDVATDMLRLGAPIPVVLDLSDMAAFTTTVVDARRNDEL